MANRRGLLYCWFYCCVRLQAIHPLNVAHSVRDLLQYEVGIFLHSTTHLSISTHRHAIYGRKLSTGFVVSVMVVGYAYCLTMAALPLIGVSSYQHSSICLPLYIANVWDQTYLFVGLVMALVAFTAMIGNYIAINCILRNKQTPTREEDRQILVRTVVLIGTDMLCLVPTLFLGLTAAIGVPLITLTQAKVCLILFFPINSCANPLLYVFFTGVGRDARKKAAPVLEIISPKNIPPLLSSITPQSTIGKMTQHSHLLTRFYNNSHPSAAKLSTSSTDKDDRLAVPQRLRGLFPSASSSCLPQQLDAASGMKGRSMSGLIRLRVSQVPQVSDISEGGSCERERTDGRRSSRNMLEVRARPYPQRGSHSSMDERQCLSAKRDSGQGDSITSTKRQK